ncbi:MAG: hypothetical protein JW793_13810 [Acidobacteria bacterium]|nr:hypothetical protein [Acidobacteriota bacterium]
MMTNQEPDGALCLVYVETVLSRRKQWEIYEKLYNAMELESEYGKFSDVVRSGNTAERDNAIWELITAMDGFAEEYESGRMRKEMPPGSYGASPGLLKDWYKKLGPAKTQGFLDSFTAVGSLLADMGLHKLSGQHNAAKAAGEAPYPYHGAVHFEEMGSVSIIL